MNSKQWHYIATDENKLKKAAEDAGISLRLAHILANRGICGKEEIRQFLNPGLEALHSPWKMRDMDKAADRIVKALKNREKIVIYGDYDVDGITSTSILFAFLTGQGAEVDYFIPDRLEEGYGLTPAAMERILPLQPALIVTVDCGTTAVQEIAWLMQQGIDVVVTDHHECGDNLPQACAVVNPCRKDCEYPFKHLAGAGVTFKLICALSEKVNATENPAVWLDLVSLGTVADVVPLMGENRSIVRHGLLRMQQTANPGLRALIENAGLREKSLDSFSLGFVMAPRINAAGRIGDATRGVRLFTTWNPEEAFELAQELNEENKLRQETEQEIFTQVLEAIEQDPVLQQDRVLVVAGEEWHHGVIGIVASKITERYYKPCILLSREGDELKGSGRSVEGFNLFEALSHCRDYLVRFGGHELAAGLSLKYSSLQQFRSSINEYAFQTVADEVFIPRLMVDCDIPVKDITLETAEELEILAPFGAGNPPPVFAWQDARIEDIRGVGNGRHLKLCLGTFDFRADVIAFNRGSLQEEFSTGDRVDIAGCLEVNEWNFTRKVQFNARDIRPTHGKVLESEYFATLHNTIGIVPPVTQVTEEAGRRCSSETARKVLLNAAEQGEKVAVLVNSLETAYELEKMLKNNSLCLKKSFYICYNRNIEDSDASVQIIINPDSGLLKLSAFDRIMLCGPWMDCTYCRMLLCKLGTACVYCSGFTCKKAELERIIPERLDIGAVFQHIRACRGSLAWENPGELAIRIGERYGVHLNAFKLKMCIEILEQLDLLYRRVQGKGILFILAERAPGIRMNLETSETYRRLQSLKQQNSGCGEPGLAGCTEHLPL